jgi:hypothetical protein
MGKEENKCQASKGNEKGVIEKKLYKKQAEKESRRERKLIGIFFHLKFHVRGMRKILLEVV